METFNEFIAKQPWETVRQSIYSKTAQDVQTALVKEKRDWEDFKALISPAALPYLGNMAELSHQLTKNRFGQTIQLYAPLYLSNECQNICNYCGFSFDNKILRKTLNLDELRCEAKVLKAQGYEHILLVTGESSKVVGVDYLAKAIRDMRAYFSHIAIEVQPLEQEEYEQLRQLGLNTVLVYQETYHADNYKLHHPKGRKSNFEYRLDTPDRLGKAGIHKVGIGVLLGLEDWRVDSAYVAAHLGYLEKTYWKTKYSISFPRLRPADGVTLPKMEISDKEFVQLICAYRILNQEVELSLSTRESASFRDNIFKLGITSMSAGSKTNPGGYAGKDDSLEQFEIADHRSTEEVAAMIKSKGYDPLWKDWDRTLMP